MISRELFSIRVQTNLQTMEMKSWWRSLLPFFLALAILRETMDDGNGRQWKLSMSFWKKKQTNKQINCNFPWSVLLSTIEMTSKCSKLCGGTTSRHIIWESYLSLLSCVALLCFGGRSRLVPEQPFLRKENNKAREWRYVLWSSLER